MLHEYHVEIISVFNKYTQSDLIRNVAKSHLYRFLTWGANASYFSKFYCSKALR